MRVLVPGASGFIGKNFLIHAPDDWEIIAIYKNTDIRDFINHNDLHNVTAIKCDLAIEEEVESLSKEVGNLFDSCLYLAANTSIPHSVNDPFSDLQANTIGLLNVLKFFKGDKFIFLSSGAVYDGLSGKVGIDSSLSPQIPYAISKLASENYVKFYISKRKTFNSYVILRFFGAYGPYEPSRKIYSKLIDEFFFKNANRFTIYGDGSNLIDAMYIDDAIDGILRVLNDNKHPNIVVDFGNGCPVSIKELVHSAARIFGKDSPSIKCEGFTNEYISFSISPKAMNDLFNFRPAISIEEGLKQFASWLEMNRTYSKSS